jgi:hypothetical protein
MSEKELHVLLLLVPKVCGNQISGHKIKWRVLVAATANIFWCACRLQAQKIAIFVYSCCNTYDAVYTRCQPVSLRTSFLAGPATLCSSQRQASRPGSSGVHIVLVSGQGMLAVKIVTIRILVNSGRPVITG